MKKKHLANTKSKMKCKSLRQGLIKADCLRLLSFGKIAEAFFFIFYFVRSIMISLLLFTNAVISSGLNGLCASIARS